MISSSHLNGDDSRLDRGLDAGRYGHQLVRVDHLHRVGSGRYCKTDTFEWSRAQISKRPFKIDIFFVRNIAGYFDWGKLYKTEIICF